MSKKITGVTVGIGVKDVKEATKWYQTLLGDVEMMEPAPGTIELQLTDETWLQLDDTGYLKVGGGSTIVRFGTKDIEMAHKIAKELDPKASDIEVVEGAIKFFDFKDPAGNRLSYYELA